MKTVSMVKYELQIYFKGSSFIMPLVVTACYLYIMYSMKPLFVLSGYLLSGIFLFFLMVWIAMTAVQREDEVMEQILYLKMNSAGKYYLGKALFLICIALLYVILCIFFPVFQNAVNGGDMFIRKITGADLLNAFVILTGSAICGSCTGNLLHSRVMKDRRLAFILTVLICIMAIVQTSVIRKVPVLKFIMWIFPPVMLPSQIYRNADFFDVRHSVSLFLIFFLYALCYAVIKSILCYRNRF